ncbi:Complementary sex determiner protein [Snodgrassella alvi SCGC AB-598-J21]|uniref:Complementary sex determiner protein n=1 Tax=Snodgrassella alvi SCGC AB-598-J21 TaxID=1385367 RepID=A0A074V5F9_9NEIS|nr:Complementary sex determiner protein [Snodgrassella alvi SCGC AB-598-J21]
MAVIRARREDTFTVVDNEILQPCKLSFDARGLLCTLLSKPDDWSMNVKDLENETQGCRKHSKSDALYAMLKELKEAGYVIMERKATGEVDYFVYDTPRLVATAKIDNDTTKILNQNEVEEVKSPIGKIPNGENPKQGKSLTGKIPIGENLCLLSDNYTDGKADFVGSDSEKSEECSIYNNIYNKYNNNIYNNKNNKNNKNINKHKKTKNPQTWVYGINLLLAENIDEQLASDFIAIRKAKNAPLTLTALRGILREANKAGLTLENALRICIERNWQGFSASWLFESHNQTQSTKPSVKDIPKHTEGGVLSW